MKKIFLLLLVLLFLPTLSFSNTISGKVVKVADGDTVTILTNKKKQIRIRFYGIDMETRIFIEETLQEKVLRVTGKDITLCLNCKIGRMVYLALLPGPNTS